MTLKIKISLMAAVLVICAVVFGVVSPVRPLLIKKSLIFAELARSPEERMQGLQFRAELGPGKGMLFCFEKPGVYAFWMKNTQIPLDIAFIDENKVIVDIQQMAPLDEGPRYMPEKQAKYALEVDQGYFKEHGIDVGERVFFW